MVTLQQLPQSHSTRTALAQDVAVSLWTVKATDRKRITIVQWLPKGKKPFLFYKNPSARILKPSFQHIGQEWPFKLLLAKEDFLKLYRKSKYNECTSKAAGLRRRHGVSGSPNIPLEGCFDEHNLEASTLQPRVPVFFLLIPLSLKAMQKVTSIKIFIFFHINS